VGQNRTGTSARNGSALITQFPGYGGGGITRPPSTGGKGRSGVVRILSSRREARSAAPSVVRHRDGPRRPARHWQRMEAQRSRHTDAIRSGAMGPARAAQHGRVHLRETFQTDSRAGMRSTYTARITATVAVILAQGITPRDAQNKKTGHDNLTSEQLDRQDQRQREPGDTTRGKAGGGSADTSAPSGAGPAARANQASPASAGFTAIPIGPGTTQRGGDTNKDAGYSA